MAATRAESAGRCETCGAQFSKRQMVRHLSKCAYPEAKNVAAVIRLRVDVPGSPFWMDLDVRSDATLATLDDFLRNLWLECCGHLSSFEIGGTRYMVVADLDQRSIDERVSAALPPVGGVFEYEYDFGSSTDLRLKVVGQHDAPRRRGAVRLLARNDAPVWPCNECAEPATSLCSYCIYGGDAFVCKVHVKGHECGDEAMLPVVNSPRMGVCAYTG